MALYRYVKAHVPGVTAATSTVNPPLAIPTIPKFLPVTLMGVGAFLIAIVATPILYYEVITAPTLHRPTIISPLPGSTSQLREQAQVAGISSYIPPIQTTTDDTTAETPAKVDYTQATNWFPTAPVVKPNPSKITHYTISIPKLKIYNAVVAIGGSDLRKTLIQYGGTANPGEYGSPVIFGHSILRQFYSPAESNPNRYISIFSTIMTLEKGDEMTINFDGIEYTYRVVDKYAIKPTQVEILQQRYDRQTLKLITCIPEGTYKERGVIEAQLVQT